jgi:Gamma-glutamyl cyclotransferase, AIG2-like
MPLFFAYGANMDVGAMARRCPRSKPLGVARLMRHRLVAMREGWLNVTRDAHASVHGVLWDVALADVAALDRYEGLGEGLYAKALQGVVGKGGAKRALVYFGANNGPGIVQADYLEVVIGAARHWDLPPAALAALRAFSTKAGEGASGMAPRVRPRFATPFDRP